MTVTVRSIRREDAEAVTGMTKVLAAVMKASRAFSASPTVKRRSSTANPSRPARSKITVRVMPRRIPLSAGRVTSVPALVTIQAFVEAPSVTNPSSSTNHASKAPASFACCLASTLGSSEVLLMSTRSQRFSGTVITATPSAARRSAPAALRLRAVTTMLGAVPAGGNA